MAELTAYGMGKLFTSLVGREVRFMQVAEPPSGKTKQIYGVYLIEPTTAMSVVQADLLLLATFGGSLLGFPASAIKEHVAEAELDEKFRDAIHEVLNIASTIASLENRAVFQGMFSDPIFLPKAAMDTLRNPDFSLYFNVTVDGYDGGVYRLLSPM